MSFMSIPRQISPRVGSLLLLRKKHLLTNSEEMVSLIPLRAMARSPAFTIIVIQEREHLEVVAYSVKNESGEGQKSRWTVV